MKVLESGLRGLPLPLMSLQSTADGTLFGKNVFLYFFLCVCRGAALVVAAPLCVRTVEPERMFGAAGG